MVDGHASQGVKRGPIFRAVGEKAARHKSFCWEKGWSCGGWNRLVKLGPSANQRWALYVLQAADLCTCVVVCNAFPIWVATLAPIRATANRYGRAIWGKGYKCKRVANGEKNYSNGLCSQTAWVGTVTLPLVSCVTLSYPPPL